MCGCMGEKFSGLNMAQTYGNETPKSSFLATNFTHLFPKGKHARKFGYVRLHA